MMVGSRLGYAASLLLAGPKHGAALRILDVRVAYEPQTLERERIKVNRSPVNGDHNSELAISARHAGTVALQLLFREQNRNDPVARLWFDIEQPSMAVTGRSAELLFGLVTYLRLGEASLPEGTPKGDFMATGALDGDGNVGSVEAVATKINAALVSNPSVGTRLFYPRADEAQIDEPLRQLCRDKGLLLCPVSRIDEALDSLGVPILGSWPSDLSPFRSLEAFDSRFSRVFFGRQREVEQLLMLLDARAATGKAGALIIGASGAGKSSFCLAGLVPALVKQKPGLRCAVWRPRDAASGDDNSPTDEAQLADNILAQWQARDESQNGLSLTLPADSPTTLDQLAKSLTTASAEIQIFIVDQFEELFTLAFMPEARIAFARFLQQLQARGVWVIGTLRSEFYAQYLEMCDADGQPVLTPIFEGDGQYNLPRMSRDSFAQVIMRPAELAGLKFEQRPDGVTLAQSLLADAMSTEDALPLLGFALHWLYEQQGQSLPKGDKPEDYARTLRFADYERLGGLAGAIGTVAAQAYDALPTNAQKELPALLSALAVPSADGNRETARPAPLQLWPVGSAGRALIDALVKIRVLVSEDGITPETPAHIRVAHEALFSHWDLAAQLLNESRQSRLMIEDFRQRAKLWDADNRPKEALLSSPRDIANARAVLPFVPLVEGNGPLIAFIENSIARVRRRRQIWFASAAAIALSLTGTATWALYAAEQAKISAAQARKSEQKALLSASAERLAKTEAQKAQATAEQSQRLAENAAKAEQMSKLQAQAAAVAEREQRAEALRQRDMAELRSQEAIRARELAQTALDKTVVRLTSATYQDDSRYENLQQDLLTDLVPVYLKLSQESSSDRSAVKGYIEAVDELASLLGSSTSLEQATLAYPTTIELLSQAGLTEDHERTAAARIALNYASTLFANGEVERAKQVLSSPLAAGDQSLQHDCLKYRIESSQDGEQDSNALRDALIGKVASWQPANIEERKARVACLIAIGSVYSNNNERDQADRAFLEAEASLATMIVEKPFSVDTLLSRAQLHISNSRHQYFVRNINGAKSKLRDAAAIIENALKISPNNRAAIEAKLQVSFLIYRIEAQNPDGQASSDITKEIDAWTSSVERLIQRDPNSLSLERSILSYGQDAFEPVLNIDRSSKPLPPELCYETSDQAIAIAQRNPTAFVAQKFAVELAKCLFKVSSAKAEEVNDLAGATKTNSADEGRWKSGIDGNVSQPALLSLNSVFLERRGNIKEAWNRALNTAPNESRRFDTLAQRIAFLEILAGDEQSLIELRSLADSESQRQPDSLRFTLLGWQIRVKQATALVDKEPETARSILNSCPHYSADQQLMCNTLSQMLRRGAFGDKIAQFGSSFSVFQTVGAAGGPGTEAHARISNRVFDPKQPVEILIFDGEKVSVMDDVAAFADILPNKSNSKEVEAVLSHSIASGRDMIEAYSFLREGPQHLLNAELDDEQLEKLYQFYRSLYGWPDLCPREATTEDPKKTWKSMAFSCLSAPIALDEALLKEEVTILLQGKNIYKTNIYTYLKLTLANLVKLRDVMKMNKDFQPAEYGEVLSSGFGWPSRALRKKMAEEHNMVDVPRPKPQ